MIDDFEKYFWFDRCIVEALDKTDMTALVDCIKVARGIIGGCASAEVCDVATYQGDKSLNHECVAVKGDVFFPLPSTCAKCEHEYCKLCSLVWSRYDGRSRERYIMSSRRLTSEMCADAYRNKALIKYHKKDEELKKSRAKLAVLEAEVEGLAKEVKNVKNPPEVGEVLI